MRFGKHRDERMRYLVAAGTGTEVSVRKVELLHAQGAVVIFFVRHHGCEKELKAKKKELYRDGDQVVVVEVVMVMVKGVKDAEKGRAAM